MSNNFKRVIIICEGPTEKEFCTDVLQPMLITKNIYIHTPLIKKSGGGIVSWSNLRKQVENHLKSDHSAIVTTLIDYYGIYEKHGYPCWNEAHQKQNKSQRLDLIEEGMQMDLEEDMRYRFIPYIQLHEFEGLLFTDSSVFDRNFLLNEFNEKTQFDSIFTQFPNPEDINDGTTTAPSKRLERHIIGYNKPVYGALIAQDIGLPRIRSKCPRFNNWLNKIAN